MEILALGFALLVFILLLSVLVLIHEAGHFFVARRFGIKVEEFGFGFPPKMLSFKRGETEYSINWFPLGGFVKLYGEDDAGAGRIGKTGVVDREAAKDKDRAFFVKSPWQRAAVVVAGVVMNALLSIVIFYIFLGLSGFKTQLPLLNDHKFFWVNQENTPKGVIIENIAPNSPAALAKMKPQSKVIAVNNKPIASGDDFVTTVNKNKGKEITIQLQEIPTNKTYSVIVTPRVDPPKEEGSLGVRLQFIPFATANLTYETPVQKAFSGVIHPINLLAYNFDALGSLISSSLKEKKIDKVAESVSGPVGIFSFVSLILRLPWKEAVMQLLNLAGFMSAFLAFVNILPIPALDGGRLFFILIEAFTGKKLNPKIEAVLNSVFMMLLIGFMLLVTLKDFFYLFSGKLPLMP